MCAVYGESSVTEWMCQKWFVNFHAGDFSLDDAWWSGIPVKVDGNQIETLIENIQCSLMWEIADKPKISKSMKLLVKMKNASFILRKNLNRRFGWPTSWRIQGQNKMLWWSPFSMLRMPVQDAWTSCRGFLTAFSHPRSKIQEHEHSYSWL